MSDNSEVPRRRPEELPLEVREVVADLMKLARRDGMTRTKLAECSAVLAAAAKRAPKGASGAELARLAEDSVRTQINSLPNLTDRALLVAGLNSQGTDEPTSYEARITHLVNSTPEWQPAKEIDSEGAIGRFRSQLTIELAWRLLGGAPTYAMPRPPSDDLELADRLRRQHRDGDAVSILKRVATDSQDESDRRDAWRLLATIGYESGQYDGAELVFNMAFNETSQLRRGGRLAMAVDRYARRLTDEEEYDRAIAIVSKALGIFFEGRWLWRRYGCIRWYAGDLLDAYSALTVALNLGYPASRVFHARGQVLAELGRYDEAIAELNEALRVPRSSLSAAQAIGGRAYAVGMSGYLKDSLTDFDTAAVTTPESGWLWYWRALCLRHNGQPEEAVADLERCLTLDLPRLPGPRRAHALRLLESELQND
jgi:tetratricopeptide (TPR) repeat protein